MVMALVMAPPRRSVAKLAAVTTTNRRVPVRHDSPEAIVSERPELRIVDQELWEATQERLKSVHRFYTRSADGSPKGRAIPGARSAYPFSSLLCCGVCGGKMSIGGGSKDAYYRCEGHKKRGTCDNAMSVRESVLSYARKRLRWASADSRGGPRQPSGCRRLTSSWGLSSSSRSV